MAFPDRTKLPLTPSQEQVLAAVTEEWTHRDEIAERAGRPVYSILRTLYAKGRVERDGTLYRLSPDQATNS